MPCNISRSIMATSAEILTPFTVLAAFQIIGIRECFHWISQTKRREAVRMGFSRIIKSIFSAMVSPADDPCAIKWPSLRPFSRKENLRQRRGPKTTLNDVLNGKGRVSSTGSETVFTSISTGQSSIERPLICGRSSMRSSKAHTHSWRTKRAPHPSGRSQTTAYWRNTAKIFMSDKWPGISQTKDKANIPRKFHWS
jgi:hypothetical protein